MMIEDRQIVEESKRAYGDLTDCYKPTVDSPDKEVRTFSTGAIRDSENGKEDMVETISWLAMREYARYMTEKKKQYGEGNWSLGIEPKAYLRSAMRHMRKFLCEWEYGICEEKTNHLCAALFNILGLIHEMELCKLGEGRFDISEKYKKLYLEDASSD